VTSKLVTRKFDCWGCRHRHGIHIMHHGIEFDCLIAAKAVIDSYAANFAQLGFGVGGRPGTAAAMTHRFLNGIEAAAAVDCHY